MDILNTNGIIFDAINKRIWNYCRWHIWFWLRCLQR